MQHRQVTSRRRRWRSLKYSRCARRWSL